MFTARTVRYLMRVLKLCRVRASLSATAAAPPPFQWRHPREPALDSGKCCGRLAVRLAGCAPSRSGCPCWRRAAKSCRPANENVISGGRRGVSSYLWILALGDETEVLVPDFLDFEQAGAGADVRLLQLLGPVDDGRAAGARDAVVVTLADAPDCADAGLQEEMLGDVGDALLGEDDVRLEGDYVVTLASHEFFFQFQHLCEILREIL